MGSGFVNVEKFLGQIDPTGIVLEIGSSRGHNLDRGTLWLANLAKQLGTEFVTVDMDPAIHAMHTEHESYCMTGEEFLANHLGDRKISLALLDNFDWDWHPNQQEQFVVEQIARYNELGVIMNNVNSQQAHLTQAIAVELTSTDNSVIVLDDTFYMPHLGHYSGKGSAAVPYLLSKGYRVLYEEEHPVYVVILGRFKK